MTRHESADLSSALRKRALRKLSHEQCAAYTALYERLLAENPGLTRYQARGRTWTLLRYQFPDRYLELFALERSGGAADLPPDVRTRSWRRANARLAEIRETAYRPRYAEFAAQGMLPAKAHDRAIAAVRQDNPDLFGLLLAQEYEAWLAAADTRREPLRRWLRMTADQLSRAGRSADRAHDTGPAAEQISSPADTLDVNRRRAVKISGSSTAAGSCRPRPGTPCDVPSLLMAAVREPARIRCRLARSEEPRT
ncbi:MAG TPA: hypothetical protein VKU39_03520 [Streptosporangiaceae bacterium]|nr:hypothetical protein [Streptosporangiaceae bacterium]